MRVIKKKQKWPKVIESVNWLQRTELTMVGRWELAGNQPGVATGDIT